MTDVTVRRGFADIAEGQMHYRTCGPDNGPVLVMLHGSPLSAHSVVPLMKEMGKTFRVIAPDMLGNGDSSAPQKIPVTIPYLSDAMTRAMDSLGLREYYLYGYHTGGNLALKERWGATIVGPRADRDRIPGIDIEVGEGDHYQFGAERAAERPPTTARMSST